MSHPAVATPRPPGLRRGGAAASAVVAAVLTSGALAAPASAAPAPASVKASQSLVVLLHAKVARTRPSVTARRLETVAARRPLTGVRTTLPVIDQVTRQDGRLWLQVRLPGRPNQHAGWIPATRTRRTSTGWQLSVDLSARRVTASFAGRVARRFSAIVGAGATPTPRGGGFFIEEGVSLRRQDAGGPFALATSARSTVLQEFEGGPGQIALHGIDNLTGELGTAVSHGCVRLSTPAITWLAGRVGAGVPLTITR